MIQKPLAGDANVNITTRTEFGNGPGYAIPFALT